jgi:sugar/nucleoside kinase (ribokinase family)
VPLAAGDWVFVSGYDLAYPELGGAIAAWVREMPPDVQLVVDPGPLAAEISASVLQAVMPRATIWTMNSREAELLTGTTEPAAVRQRLRPGLAPDALLVLRWDAAGAFLSVEAGAVPILVPAPPVTAVDSTGAGDTHTGVLIASLAQGLDRLAALRRANAAAAISVTRAGPATAPDRRALDAVLGEPCR